MPLSIKLSIKPSCTIVSFLVLQILRNPFLTSVRHDVYFRRLLSIFSVFGLISGVCIFSGILPLNLDFTHIKVGIYFLKNGIDTLWSTFEPFINTTFFQILNKTIFHSLLLLLTVFITDCYFNGIISYQELQKIVLTYQMSYFSY